jgi:hypothetical protein
MQCDRRSFDYTLDPVGTDQTSLRQHVSDSYFSLSRTWQTCVVVDLEGDCWGTNRDLSVPQLGVVIGEIVGTGSSLDVSFTGKGVGRASVSLVVGKTTIVFAINTIFTKMSP